MAIYGKRGLSSSAAVLDAPEPDAVPQTQWPIPEPAPAGTLQRRSWQDKDDRGAVRSADEDAYTPRRLSAVHQIRTQLLKTMPGRIIGGSVAVLALGLVLGAILGVRRSLLHDPRFVIATSSEIQITGSHHLTRGQVLSVFGADLERNIFKIPLAERRADLQRLPWVANANVMRLLPNVLRIAITERTPVAFVRQGSQIGLVDATGVLLDMPQDVAGDPHYSFPVLTGLAESDPLSVREARMVVYRRFLQELDSTGEKLSESLSEVDVSNPEDVKAVVTNGGADVLVHFGDENFLARYKMFAQNLPQWKNQYPKLASVDTRYENEFVLEMQPGSAVPLAGDATASAATTDTANTATADPKTPPHSIAKAAKPLPAVARRPVLDKPKPKPAPVKKPILVHAYTPADGQVNR